MHVLNLGMLFAVNGGGMTLATLNKDFITTIFPPIQYRGLRPPDQVSLEGL